MQSVADELSQLPPEEVSAVLSALEEEMATAAASMDFERAAQLRDQVVALRAALEGNTGQMMFFRRVSDVPYAVTIEMTDAANVANLEKMFPEKWISPEQNQVTDAAIGYFLPLVQGEVDICMKNGLPVHFQRPLQMR